MFCVSGDSSRVEEFIAYCRTVKFYYLFMTKFLYNDKIEPNIAFLSSPSIINEQRKLLGWNLITFALEGIHDIFKMILIESFTSKNTKR